MALDAGVQERQVRLAEQIGAQFAMALRGIFAGLDLTPAQAAKWEGLVKTNMLAIDAQLASWVEDEDDRGFEHPEVPTVWDDDPNPVIGTILDHRGEVICVVRVEPEPERRTGYRDEFFSLLAVA